MTIEVKMDLKVWLTKYQEYYRLVLDGGDKNVSFHELANPQVGDWVIEYFMSGLAGRPLIGKLVEGDKITGKYLITLVGGEEQPWENAYFMKVPDAMIIELLGELP